MLVTSESSCDMRKRFKLNSMRATLFFFLSMSAIALNGQNDTLLMGMGNRSDFSVITPKVINASDGVYDKFVLIRWDSDDKMSEFRLFRASSASGASMQELTKSWQKSTWFCDYSAEKNRDYFYAVIASDKKTSSPLSSFDKGFLKKEEKIAQDESLSATTQDKYAAGKQIFVLVSSVDTDIAEYQAGSRVNLNIELQNIFEESTPRTDLLVYLSKDLTWDFEDKLLASKSYSGFPGNLKASINEVVALPENLLPGMYHFIIVAASEGNILNAKTGSVTFKILGK